jgi:hypothetical protein
MKLDVQRHIEQRARWPKEGKHILAQYDDASVIVYQAYRPSIGHHAAEHGRFGGPDFSFARMSWVKPNFLWMMYRSGWGTKEGQEVTLALRLRRGFFESLLAAAVPSSFDPERHASHEAWQQAVASSDVRLQWDPDHAPGGAALPRRAIQLGLRGDALAKMAESELLEVIDVSAFVEAQRANAQDQNPQLLTPLEHVFVPTDRIAASRLNLSV